MTQAYLLATLGDAQPKAVALMFPGGSGLVGLPAGVNQLRPGSNFLVRTRDLFRAATSRSLSWTHHPTAAPG